MEKKKKKEVRRIWVQKVEVYSSKFKVNATPTLESTELQRKLLKYECILQWFWTRDVWQRDIYFVQRQVRDIYWNVGRYL